MFQTLPVGTAQLGTIAGQQGQGSKHQAASTGQQAQGSNHRAGQQASASKHRALTPNGQQLHDGVHQLRLEDALLVVAFLDTPSGRDWQHKE